MHGRLVSLTTVDGDDLTSVVPAAGPFGVWLRAIVSPADGPGEESFDLLVCNPPWLSGELTKGFRWGRGLLIVSDWDRDLVERSVRDLVAHSSGRDWPRIAEMLARYTHWELGDYES